MTIALGILCEDGVVIAADTEETQGDYKLQKSKVTAFTNGPHSCAVTGSGDSGYLDGFAAEVREAFTNHPTNGFHADISQRLRLFYQQDILPFEQAQSPDPPILDVVIGVQRHDGTPTLYMNQRSRLISVEPYAAVGIGAPAAKVVLHSLALGSFLYCHLARVIAIQAILAAKEFVGGCGKATQVTTIQRSGASAMTWQEIEAIERIFERDYRVSSQAHWSRFVGQRLDLSGPVVKILPPSRDE